LDEACFFVDDVELVLVDQLVVAGAQFADRLVVLVHDGDMAVAVAVAGVVVALETEQDVFALPAGRLEVGRPDAVDAVSGPDQVAVIAEDVGAGLPRTVLLRGSVRVPGKRSHEKVPLFDILGGRDTDVQPGRRKVRPGTILPVGRGGAEQKARRSEGRRQLHDGAPRSVELGASATMAPILFNDRYIHLRLVYAPKKKMFVKFLHVFVASRLKS
jgi:hypothetical protein